MAQKRCEEALDEPLVLASIGKKGYLKFPRAFLARFDFIAQTIPNPTPILEVRNGKVRLIYEWSEDEMTAAAVAAASIRVDRRTSQAKG